MRSEYEYEGASATEYEGEGAVVLEQSTRMMER